MAEVRECLVEEREELMISPMGSSRSILRMAHFLKPHEVSTFKPLPPLPRSRGVVPPTFDPKSCRLKVKFGLERYASDWKEWVDHLEPRFHGVWKQAGIYSAIMSSTCRVARGHELIMGLAEKWCTETKSFVFPWGEATLTLEDAIILGGYSVLGSPVFAKREVKVPAEVALAKAVKELAKESSPYYVNLGDWIRNFKLCGSKIEHEAFLSLWLHWILSSASGDRIRFRNFGLAARLAEGERMALAPAVLSGIYRDLSLLKFSIVDGCGDRSLRCINSQIQLVQLWAWEKFPVFRPMQNSIKIGDPRYFLWDKVNPKKVENVRVALDSAGETFCWRPYTIGINGWQLPRFYRDKEGLQDLGSDEDLVAFALCLRVSKLVGLDCIQNYSPHRVAMQFGLDQDVPCDFATKKETPEAAWMDYMRPFTAEKLYIPSRWFESDVTEEYLEWWKKQSIFSCPPRLPDNVMQCVKRRKRSSRKRLKRVPSTVAVANADHNAEVLSGSPPNYSIVNNEGSIEAVQPEVERKLSDAVAARSDLSMAGWGDRLCSGGYSNCEMESPIGQFEEFAQARGQVDKSARMSIHEIAAKDEKPFGCQQSANRTIGENGGHTNKASRVELGARIARLQREFCELKAIVASKTQEKRGICRSQ